MTRPSPRPDGLEPFTALIDFADPHASEGRAATRLRFAFATPRAVLQTQHLHEVTTVLHAVQTHAQAGRWCVGYVSYEAAPAFDSALQVHTATGPLVWFAVYDEALPWPADLDAAQGLAPEIAWQWQMDRAQFDAALATLHAGIAQGDYYQVNLTAPLTGTLHDTEDVEDVEDVEDASSDRAHSSHALFAALRRAQPGGYSAYIDTGDTQVLSVSPELFFDWRDGHLLTRPMKGTAARGATPDDDALQAQALRNSPKERAENVMVVDMLRNDVSRIAEPHSVQVPRLFHTQALPSVWQMTSDVTARTRAGCNLADVFTALFPCGSITGAPKVQAMRAIQALEPQARGVYCGAVGVIKPGGAAIFNVPIRTVTLQGDQARCGLGSGITSGSVADDEWAEWQHKRAFVHRATTRFELLETLGLLNGQWHNLNEHLARIQQAALHFGYPWLQDLMAATLQPVQAQHASGPWRVRLLLDAQGRATAQAFALPATPERVRLQLASRPLQEAHGEFVRFKTTHRPHYDAFTPTQPDVFDTLLFNPQGELTECTRGNIALQIGGRWVTPPLRCGLLGGVGRASALQQGRVVEAVVRVDDLPQATGLAFINSLRGWVPADLAP